MKAINARGQGCKVCGAEAAAISCATRSMKRLAASRYAIATALRTALTL